MNKQKFEILCGNYLIDVVIALENENIKQALSDRNDEEVERILRDEF